MPLYEYECQECGKKFETLVQGSRIPSCPGCGSEKLEKQLSTFGVGGFSSSSKGLAPCGSPVPAGGCGTSGGG
jgi:putative FmdB family regulatory protein